MAQQALSKSHLFILRYAGMSFYWAWVFLSFNSIDITGQVETADVLVTVHVVSAFAAACMFVFVIIFYRQVMAFCLKRKGLGLICLSLVACAGTALYTLPFLPFNIVRMAAGAAISGIPCSLLILFWGMAYRDLGARDSVLFTAGSFLLTAFLYLVVANLEPTLAALCVSLFPLAAALSLLSSLKQQPDLSDYRFLKNDNKKETEPSWVQELKSFLGSAFSWRVALGFLTTLFAYGGLRVYLGEIAPSVYQEPLAMTAAIAISSLVLLVYGRFISKTSLNLGAFYRIAMPLFALGFILVAIFGNENTSLVFLLISIGSVLFEILTWVLLVEIARTTHFPALFIFAVGRFVVHVGLMAGQLTASFMPSGFLIFAVISIPLLILSAGFAFAEKDTTFQFEPPTDEELKKLSSMASKEKVFDKKQIIDISEEQKRVFDEGSLSIANELLEQMKNYPLVNEGLVNRISFVAQEYNLSPRETEVFALWVTGHGTKYIQEKLVVSKATIKTHVRHIYEKCDVHNRAELIGRLENL